MISTLALPLLKSCPAFEMYPSVNTPSLGVFDFLQKIVTMFLLNFGPIV